MNLYGEDGNCIGDYIKYNSSLDGYTIMNGALNLKMSNAEPLPQDYNPSHLYDCDLDTYALVNCQYAKEYNEVGVDFIFAFKQAVKIDAYRFTTFEIGCPVSWTLFASNDKKLKDEVCTAIDVRTDEAMPAYEYGESDVFEVQNTGYYKYYKIRIYKDIFGGNDENWLNPAWRELTLLMKNENVGKTN